MSELKVYTQDEILDSSIGDDVYLQPDVDKILAEKDKKIAELKDIDSKNRSAYYKDLSMMAKDVEHQKLKRCLAMAKWCRSRACFYDTMRADSLFWAWKSDRAYKWHKRWLELSEKFKEAK